MPSHRRFTGEKWHESGESNNMLPFRILNPDGSPCEGYDPKTLKPMPGSEIRWMDAQQAKKFTDLGYRVEQVVPERLERKDID